MSAFIIKNGKTILLTNEERDKMILDMAEKEIRTTIMAETLHVGIETIYKVLKENHIDRIGKTIEKNEKLKQDVIGMYKEGKCIKEIAAEFKKSTSYVGDVLRKAGFDLKTDSRKRILERNQKVLELYKQGVERQQIMEECQVSEQIIYKIVRAGQEELDKQKQQLYNPSFGKKQKEEETVKMGQKETEETMKETPKQKLIRTLRTNTTYFEALKVKVDERIQVGDWKPFLQFTQLLLDIKEEKKAKELIDIAKQAETVPRHVSEKVQSWERIIQRKNIRRYIASNMQKGRIEVIEELVDKYIAVRNFSMARQVIEVSFEYATRDTSAGKRILKMRDKLETEKKVYLLEMEEKKRQQEMKQKEVLEEEKER